MTNNELEIKKMLIINEMRGYAETYKGLYERYMDPNDLDDPDMATSMMDMAACFVNCMSIVEKHLK